MLGAASILLQVTDGDDHLNFLFTGDYNNKNDLFKSQCIPEYIKELDLIIFQEATYGDSFSSEIEEKYNNDIIRLLKKNMTIVHTANACERVEQILLRLKKLQSNGSISSDIPIFVDSPLGIDYIVLYSKLCDVNFIPKNLFIVDPKNKKMHNKKGCLKDVKYISEIPLDNKAKIIIVSSGCANYGKAPYYISKLANREDVTIYFSSYLPYNSLGRKILDAKKGDKLKINVFGKTVYIKLNCNVEITNEFSSHARSDELLNFLKMFKNIKLIFLNHGEEMQKKAYQKMIESNLHLSSHIVSNELCYIMENFKIIKTINSKYSKKVNSKRKKY